MSLLPGVGATETPCHRAMVCTGPGRDSAHTTDFGRGQEGVLCASLSPPTLSEADSLVPAMS